jgi:alkanesulfonate monooxygenase
MVLVGYTSSSAEGFLVAMHAAARTERLSYLVAHRPGFVRPRCSRVKWQPSTISPVAASRCTLSPARPMPTGMRRRLRTQGRALSEGAEVSASDEAHLGFERTVRLSGSLLSGSRRPLGCAPRQTPHPLIMFGGASESALEMGAAECDVFAIYAEPRATTAERIAEFRARAARHGRTVGLNMSVRPIIAATRVRPGTRRHVSSAA